jgi:UDP-N-acetylmuramoylalanine--D-glutamate ligase
MYAELEQLVSFLRNKKILIAGFGREGQSSFRFLQKYVPEATIAIADFNVLTIDQPEVEIRCGKQYLDFDNSFDLMLRSPGISLMNIPSEWRDSGKMSSQTDLLLQFFSSQVIGITGTKGKSTTTSLIFHILKQCGVEAILAGNMGLPFFDQLAETENKKIVAELSSHQLETVHHSPSISVLLNIFPEHLDHYVSFNDYALAKWNIARFQQDSDVFLLSGDLFKAYSSEFFDDFRGQKVLFGSIDAYEKPFSVFTEEKWLLDLLQKHIELTFEKNRIALRGNHNRSNIAAALGAAVAAGVLPNQALEAVYSFESLPHRLEWVGTVSEIGFVNDSISTIPQSTIAALEAFPETETLILGGFDRGIDYSVLVNFLANHRVLNVILMGPVGLKLGEMHESRMLADSFFYAPNMQKAIEFAVKRTPKGKICLLSPAASSYDQYLNFEHRGDDFRHWVRKLGK